MSQSSCLLALILGLARISSSQEFQPGFRHTALASADGSKLFYTIKGDHLSLTVNGRNFTTQGSAIKACLPNETKSVQALTSYDLALLAIPCQNHSWLIATLGSDSITKLSILPFLVYPDPRHDVLAFVGKPGDAVLVYSIASMRCEAHVYPFDHSQTIPCFSPLSRATFGSSFRYDSGVLKMKIGSCQVSISFTTPGVGEPPDVLPWPHPSVSWSAFAGGYYLLYIDPLDGNSSILHVRIGNVVYTSSLSSVAPSSAETIQVVSNNGTLFVLAWSGGSGIYSSSTDYFLQWSIHTNQYIPEVFKLGLTADGPVLLTPYLSSSCLLSSFDEDSTQLQQPIPCHASQSLSMFLAQCDLTPTALLSLHAEIKPDVYGDLTLTTLDARFDTVSIPPTHSHGLNKICFNCTGVAIGERAIAFQQYDFVLRSHFVSVIPLSNRTRGEQFAVALDHQANIFMATGIKNLGDQLVFCGDDLLVQYTDAANGLLRSRIMFMSGHWSNGTLYHSKYSVFVPPSLASRAHTFGCVGDSILLYWSLKKSQEVITMVNVSKSYVKQQKLALYSTTMTPLVMTSSTAPIPTNSSTQPTQTTTPASTTQPSRQSDPRLSLPLLLGVALASSALLMVAFWLYWYRRHQRLKQVFAYEQLPLEVAKEDTDHDHEPSKQYHIPLPDTRELADMVMKGDTLGLQVLVNNSPSVIAEHEKELGLLLSACIYGQADVLKILTDNLDPYYGCSALDHRGWTCAHWVCAINSVDSARVLIKWQPTLFAVLSATDETCISVAVREGNLEIVSLLCGEHQSLVAWQLYAAVSATSLELPVDAARRMEHSEIVAVLEKAMAAVIKPNESIPDVHRRLMSKLAMQKKRFRWRQKDSCTATS
eukprot:m.176870 g.176870  ORF g.176870 m.176870 type:complete len:875 (-) comp16805_c0_seq24:127-2751(-)